MLTNLALVCHARKSKRQAHAAHANFGSWSTELIGTPRESGKQLEDLGEVRVLGRWKEPFEEKILNPGDSWRYGPGDSWSNEQFGSRIQGLQKSSKTAVGGPCLWNWRTSDEHMSSQSHAELSSHTELLPCNAGHFQLLYLERFATNTGLSQAADIDIGSAFALHHPRHYKLCRTVQGMWWKDATANELSHRKKMLLLLSSKLMVAYPRCLCLLVSCLDFSQLKLRTYPKNKAG